MLSFKSVEVDSVSLTYAEAGAGRPLVCVHGNFASLRWFTSQLVTPPPGWRVLALDLPNFGSSDALPGAISVQAYARYLKGFADALELTQPVLLGHSLGGAVVQTLAARHPAWTGGFVFVAPAPPDGLVTPKETYRYLEMFKTNQPLLAQSLGATMPTRKPTYFEALVEDAWKMNRAAFTGNARALEHHNVTQDLETVRRPALVLRGGRDYLITEEVARKTVRAFQGAKLELWDDVGHSPQIEAPERFNQVLQNFLKGVPIE